MINCLFDFNNLNRVACVGNVAFCRLGCTAIKYTVVHEGAEAEPNRTEFSVFNYIESSVFGIFQ